MVITTAPNACCSALSQALQEVDSSLCTLGALQVEDQQRHIGKTSRVLRALNAQLLKAPGPQALLSGSCFKAIVEVCAWRCRSRVQGSGMAAP